MICIKKYTTDQVKNRLKILGSIPIQLLSILVLSTWDEHQIIEEKRGRHQFLFFKKKLQIGNLRIVDQKITMEEENYSNELLGVLRRNLRARLLDESGYRSATRRLYLLLRNVFEFDSIIWVLDGSIRWDFVCLFLFSIFHCFVYSFEHICILRCCDHVSTFSTMFSAFCFDFWIENWHNNVACCLIHLACVGCAKHRFNVWPYVQFSAWILAYDLKVEIKKERKEPDSKSNAKARPTSHNSFCSF